jgi:hypothetical protein
MFGQLPRRTRGEREPASEAVGGEIKRAAAIWRCVARSRAALSARGASRTAASDGKAHDEKCYAFKPLCGGPQRGPALLAGQGGP